MWQAIPRDFTFNTLTKLEILPCWLGLIRPIAHRKPTSCGIGKALLSRVQAFVKIRLDGDFERTTLTLTHRGLHSEEDRHWHAQLWERSLQKLSSLFELQ